MRAAFASGLDPAQHAFLFGEDGAMPVSAKGGIASWLDQPETPDPKGLRPKRRYRTVWISDVHLGTRGCNADMLVSFLRSIETETLYLVGDIIDGWRLKKGWYWPDAHNEVLRRILKMAHRGTRVVFICGNHDEMLRPYAGLTLAGWNCCSMRSTQRPMGGGCWWCMAMRLMPSFFTIAGSPSLATRHMS
jgi:hypothetical protein